MLEKAKLFLRGAHIPDKKALSKDIPIEEMPAPPILAISLAQHIGKPATPIVNVGERKYWFKR